MPYKPGMKLLQPLWGWSKGPQPGDSAMPLIAPRVKADSRFHGRFKITNHVTLSGEDEAGKKWTIQGRGGDMSRLGARIETGDPIAPGSFVFIQVQNLSLMGGAIVKYCVRRGLKYKIGLEFRNPLTKCF
jgi:hypothetical protein